ncbi:MAG: leucine-rich repeat protein, partial [Prevotella sp.]|nr:leucine-rich repeat protein [Prevotella sp.]
MRLVCRLHRWDSTLVLYPGALNAPITIHPDTKVIYERVCFKGAVTGTVTIPSKVQSVGMYAFYDCNNITEVVLQCTKRDVFATVEVTYEGKTYNCSRAFAECGSITKITTTNTIEL